MNTIQMVWQVPADHPALAGHFPGRPIVPGVVLLDQVMRLAQAQLAAPMEAWQVGQAKFLSPVGPGEVLTFELHADQRPGWRFTVRAADRDVASGSLAPRA